MRTSRGAADRPSFDAEPVHAAATSTRATTKRRDEDRIAVISPN
jgi:hypothetical protein